MNPLSAAESGRPHGEEDDHAAPPSRLTARLALDAETAKAAAEVTRWVRVVERMGAAGEPTRVARRFLRAARDELDRLDRVRDALPSGDGWRGEAEEVKTEEA